MIAERFGEKVATLVGSVTEIRKDLPWEDRKREPLAHIESFSLASLLLKSADVIGNLTELIDDYERTGEAVWARFNAVQLNLAWDPTWNQWKHLVPARVDIESTFVVTGRYVCRSGEWRLIRWWTALPGRTTVRLPSALERQITAARTRHHQFGQYSAEIETIRARILQEPTDSRILRRLLDEMGIPAQFDVSLVSWKADYDRFYYDELQKRARRKLGRPSRRPAARLADCR